MRHPPPASFKQQQIRLAQPTIVCVGSFARRLNFLSTPIDVGRGGRGRSGKNPERGKGGRDHWAKLGTLAFAGGGLPMGQVIGKSDRRNGEPADNPISPNMMMGTILHTLFDFGRLRVAQGIPLELIQRVEDSHPIPELVI